MTILERHTPTIERPVQAPREAPAPLRSAPPDSSRQPGDHPPRRPRRLRVLAAIAVTALAALTLVLVARGGSTPAPIADTPATVLDPATERVPSGSPFDAALVVGLDPATERVPSGSPFDAALVVGLDPATERVPSGSPFDAD